MIKPRPNKCRFCGKPLPKQEVKENLLLTGIKRLPSRARARLFCPGAEGKSSSCSYRYHRHKNNQRRKPSYGALAFGS